MGKQNLQQQQQQADPTQAKKKEKEVQGVETAVVSPYPALQRAYADPSNITPKDARILQRTIGNQALRRLVIQRKTAVGPAGDKYEQEADAVAKKVVNQMYTPSPSFAQRHEDEDALQMKPLLQRQEDEEELQMKPLLQRQEDEEELQMKPQLIQRDSASGFETDDTFESNLNRQRGGGSPLPTALRTNFEPKFGANFSGVRIHTNDQSHRLNQSIQAKAFTTGRDVFFRQDAYEPNSRGGQELIAHELTHVVQQGAASVQRQSDAHQSGCSCAGCSAAIQRHAVDDLQLNRIQRQPASHTTACSCASCNTIQRQTVTRVQRSLNGTLTKTIRPAISKVPFARATPSVVQRHSSWEHKALGDIAPEDLAILGASRNMTPGSHAKGDEATGTSLTVSPQAPSKVTAEKVTAEDGVTIKMTDKNNRQNLVPIKREDILHVIEQEIRRLNHFKNLSSIAKGAGSAGEVQQRLQEREKGALVKEAVDNAIESGGNVAEASKAAADSPEWGVKIIGIPLKDGNTEYITYGEMNTLADIYGSVKEMSKTDPQNLHGIVQGVRQQSLFRFMELYEEVSGEEKYRKMASDKRSEQNKKIEYLGAKMAGRGLAGAAGGALGLGLGAVGGALSGSVGTSKKWGKKVPVLGHLAGLGAGAVGGLFSGAVKGAKKGAELGFKGLSPEKTDKFAGLGFDDAIGNTGVGGKEGNTMGELRFMGMIPGMKGKKALKGDKSTAYEAGLARNACHFPPDSWNAWQRYHEQALVKAKEGDLNGAMVLNGFGDHFLQDSYASGHLIDKTKIMKMYVQWVDKEKKWDFHSDKNWRRIQNIAYGQEDFAGGANRYSDTAARDPQMVENQGGDKNKKHDQLGLKTISLSEDGQKLLKWWAIDIAKKSRLRSPRKKKIKTLLADSPLKDFNALQAALQEMFAKGVVRVGSFETGQRGAKSVKVKMNETVVLRQDYVPKSATQHNNMMGMGAPDTITEMSKEANTKDYDMFMKSAFLQKSTNALHDHFCEEGLDVVTGDNFAFRVYGDDSMLKKNSSAGVKHSAETTRMSRGAIESAAASASGTPDHTTAEIKNRFPKKIVDKGVSVTLDQWHNDGILKGVCENTVFPSMRKGVVNSLMQVGGMGIKDKMMGGFKDIHKPHGAEVF